MNRRSFPNIRPKASTSQEPIPKKQVITEEFWYVNAGILSDPNFEKALLFIGTYKLNSSDLRFALFLGIKYLIHYIELFTFDNTPLLIDCLVKQIKYLLSLLGKQKKSKKYLNYGFLVKLQFVFERLQTVADNNYICRQIYIDQLERFCLLFTTRLSIWLKNSRLQAYLIRFGFDPHRSAAIYNSFLIPNQRRYVDPLCRLDHKIIEKMEIKCNCRIMLSVESTECFLYPDYITLEVVFDLYHGNYIGFIEMFGYIVKRLNPTQYFVKSLRTILIEKSIFYNILTNVPIKKLKYLEKTVTAGCPITPFLSVNSISKQCLSIVAMIREEDSSFRESHSKEISNSENSEDVSKDGDQDSNSKHYYERHSTAIEFNKLQERAAHLNYSHKLLKYFHEKYNKEIDKIKFQNEKEKEHLKSLLDIKYDKLLPRKSNKTDESQTIRQKIKKNIFGKIFHDPITEKELYNNLEEIDRKKETIPLETEDIIKSTSIETNIKFHADALLQSVKGNDFKKPSKGGENYLGGSTTKTSQLNKSNPEISNNTSSNKPPIIDFNQLSPSEQFRVLLSDSFNVYLDEISWINHKMRLMLRCHTEQTIEDLKSPYIFSKRSIRDRLSNQHKNRNQYRKQKSSTQSFSNVPKLNSKMTTLSSNRSWLAKEENKFMSKGSNGDENEVTIFDSSSNSDMEILNMNDLKRELPNVAKYLQKFDTRLTNIFIRRKLFQKSNWVAFIEKDLGFKVSREMDITNICDSNDIYQNVGGSNLKEIENYKDPLTRNIFILLLLLTNKAITDKHFLEILEGRGLDFHILRKINKSRSGLPTFVGNINKTKPKTHIESLSRCLCQLVYDLLQLAHACSKEHIHILRFHTYILEKILKNINDYDIKTAFSILNLKKDLTSFNMKTYIHKSSPNSKMIGMAEQLSLLHNIIFKKPCCPFKINKNFGLRILYHSILLNDKVNAVEPFLKLPGDRRIRKIEKACNCLMALRSGKHPIIPMNEYYVDIFYDFEVGNHFRAIDLLKQIMVSPNKRLIIKNHRTLVSYPSGELWAFRETEWLRKCYNINEEDRTLIELFNNTNIKENISKDYNE